MRTDELLRRVEGLDRPTVDACQRAGWVSPESLTAGGDDSRWWSDGDLRKLRDILRFRRTGLPLEEAHRRASEDRFFGLCPCDWR
jgi:DNA-binding transcriptional MerR regulator